MLSLLIAVAFGTINYNWSPGSSPNLQIAKSFIMDYWVVIPLAIALPGLLNILHEMWDYKAKKVISDERNVLPEKILLSVLNAIKSIVGTKYDRFGRYIRDNEHAAPSFCQVFSDITKPDDQMKEIVKQLTYCLKSLMDDAEIKVILFRIDKAKKSIVAHMPPMEMPPQDLLTRSDTFVDEVADKKQCIVIESIRSEVRRKDKKKKRKYVQFSPDGNEGSIVGIPIRNEYTGSQTKYVITIKTDREGVLTRQFSKVYGKIVEHFTHRILIEDNLLTIKSRSEPCKGHQ